MRARLFTFCRSQTHIMDANEPLHEDTAPTRQFEQDLKALLLEAFATGATIEGTWELADSSKTIPTWTVEITKTAEADTRYDPEVLE